MEKHRQFHDRTIMSLSTRVQRRALLIRSFTFAIFGNSRNSSTIPSNCHWFRFFTSSLASSIRRSVTSSLDAFFSGISTIPEVSLIVWAVCLLQDNRSSCNTHFLRLWHTRDLTIDNFFLYNFWSIGEKFFHFHRQFSRFRSLALSIVRQFQPKFLFCFVFFLFIPNLFKFENSLHFSLRWCSLDVHDKKKISSPAIPKKRFSISSR